MKKKNFARIVSILLTISLFGTTLTGCEPVEKLLAPEEKEYNGNMYQQTDNADADFNNYDGKPSDATGTDAEDSTENLAEKDEYVDTAPVKLSFENPKQFSVSDQYATVTMSYLLPNTLNNVSTIRNMSRFEFAPCPAKENSYEGSTYCVTSNDNGGFRLRTVLIPTTDTLKASKGKETITLDTLVTIEADTLKKIQSTTGYSDTKENGIERLNINTSDGTINIAYRKYTYTKDGTNGAIVLVGGQYGDNFFYNEIWIKASADRYDIDDFIINLYGSVQTK